jgi:uncharacterized glyoxalase superfamily protein PhnB
MEQTNDTPAGQAAPPSGIAEKAKAEPQNQAPRSYTPAEVEAAAAEAVKKYQKSLETRETALNGREETLKKKEAEWEAKLTAARATIFNADVVAIAGKHSVDAKALKETAESLGISDPAMVEKLAAAMPKSSVPPTDSHKSMGGDDFWKLSPEEKFRQGVEEERKKRGWG